MQCSPAARVAFLQAQWAGLYGRFVNHLPFATFSSLSGQDAVVYSHLDDPKGQEVQRGVSYGKLRPGAFAWSSYQTTRKASQFAFENKATKFGPGGRSSVSGITATVFGANGFVGKYIVHELAKRGGQVVCPFRCAEENAMPLKQMGDLGQIVLLKDFDIRDDDFVKYSIRRSNLIVNLIGRSHETPNFSYKDLHTDWPARLAQFASEVPSLERFVHFSDISASEGHPSKRLRSKAAGDKAVLEALPSATIIKPANIVGDEDKFYNNIIVQTKLNPAVPLVDGGKAKLQPTYILDVADAVMAALQTSESKGKTYHLGGPEVLTLRQIVDLIYETLLEDNDEIVDVPSRLAKIMWAPLDWLATKVPISRNPMMTADFVEELLQDRLVPDGALTYRDLGIEPRKVTEGLAIEPVRHCRVGGYKYGNTENIGKNLPDHLKQYFGMDTVERTQY